MASDQQIPVGCGKTGLISILPFVVARGRVLVNEQALTESERRISVGEPSVSPLRYPEPLQSSSPRCSATSQVPISTADRSSQGEPDP
jgi:hypothetical protein